MDDIAIKVDNVSKTFKLPHEKHNSVKSLFVNLFRGRRTYEKQHVLNDVSFEIKKGEFFGIVGRNGSGKSTLLKLLAGIYVPDKGSILINGKLTPFIELGVGFNPELTGRENVFLNGALLGFNRKEMEAMYDEIVEFAELERFMDQKLKNYSSGMQVRLAFSIAIQVRTGILLLDEVLAVGDANFQRKCLNYFRVLKQNKQTVVFISHDMNAVSEFCDRAAIIDKGAISYIGKTSTVVKKYGKINFEDASQTKEVKNKKKRTVKTPVRIMEIVLLDKDGNTTNYVGANETMRLRMLVKIQEPIETLLLGMEISDFNGNPLFTVNNQDDKRVYSESNVGDSVELSASLVNIFGDGTYFLSGAAKSGDRKLVYDQAIHKTSFEISGWGVGSARVNLLHEKDTKVLRG